jgi:uncharacterized membrane protein
LNKNMSNVDRALRAFLIAPAAVIVGALLGPTSVLAIVVYALAVVMLATAAAGFCPLYALLHIDSRRWQPAHRKETHLWT